MSGETTDFEGQLAATLSAALVRGPFSSAATVLVQPQAGLRIEGRYALPAQTSQRPVALVATTTIFPTEKTRVAIGVDVQFGAVHFLADLAYEQQRYPEVPP